jgi:hypothetical protein
MKIDFADWFEEKPEKVLMGIELELFLFDSKTKQPLRDMGIIEQVVKDLPWNVYRDYYPHQLEIRTDPFDNPEDVIKQTKQLYTTASKELRKHGIFIIPAPNITTDSGYMWCGMHVHLSYPDRKQTAPYWNKAMGMYPFILSLADHTKNFEVNELNAGERISSSRHIGIPYLHKPDFLRGNGGDRKFRDVILSKEITEEHGEGRHRLVKPNTIEFRIFDTPSLLSTYESMVYMMFNLASYMKINNPMVKMIEENSGQTQHLLEITRRYISSQRYAVNKIFHKLNTDVCDDVSEYFKIPFDRKTQFEFREELGLNANVNGYLSMAIEGGWL